MKNISAPKDIKIYKIKFTKAIIALAIAVMVFCTAGIIFSILQIIHHGIVDFSDVLKYPFLILISVFCIALVIAILVKSQYVINQNHLTSQFGFIKSKFDIKKITAVILDTDTNKLTVHCGEEFFIISLDKEWNEAFVRDLLAVNPHIDYSFTVSEKKD